MPHKVLIVGPAWIGDMVIMNGLCQVLRQQDPDTVIDVLSPAWSQAVLSRMPEVRRGIEEPTRHGELGLGKLRRLGHALAAEHYDRAIILPRKLKAALVPWFAGIPQRTGYRGEMRFGVVNDMRTLDETKRKLMIERHVGLAPLKASDPIPDYPFPRLSVDLANRQRLIDELGLRVDRPVVVLCPGAEFGPAKCWPPEYFGALAAGLATRGIDTWILGSAKEHALGEIVRGASGGKAINLCGKTKLLDAVDLLSAAGCVVANDSGLMHTASALDVPVVALYGSIPPEVAPPLTDKGQVIYLGISCSPCWQRTCPLGHHNCMRQIEVNSVQARVVSALS